MSEQPMFDVVAINMRNGNERVLERDKTEPNAEAIAKMAVWRLGVETEFYILKPIWRSL